MNIAWITVRKWADFCSTTTNALATGLVARGHDLTILNGDATEAHADFPWNHIALEQSPLPGRKGASLARNASRWFQKNQHHPYDAVIVDWPLASGVAAELTKQNLNIVLMDRSPPADVSLLGKLQWRVWRKAWKLVNQGVIRQGTVVSPAHKEFVQRRCSVNPNVIHSIPAGVDLKHFSSQNKTFDGAWKMVYHGRLDKHRGVLALPMLVQKLLNHGVRVQLTLIGEGDAFEALEAVAANQKAISISPSISTSEISTELESHHIGLLPMPDTPVWSIASPLKRSEYLAAGLMIYGIDHAGHQLNDTSENWFRLSPMEDFHAKAIEWLSGLTEAHARQGCLAARTYAENHCSWEKSVETLELVLQASSKPE